MVDEKEQLYGKVTEDMDFFKKILSKVPGFGGYIERQKRRDSDKLIREYIFDQFRELEGRVSRLQKDFISQGEIAYVDDLEATAIKLRTFADRIKTAARGYSGLFDAVNVNEAELTRLYEYDATMLDFVDQVNHAIDNVESSVGSEGLPAAIRNLETKAEDCIKAFDDREAVILGLEG
ncbi:MAG: hypothetical protein JSV42_14720 [Chloroflexota bacterium]|nr:MAG: hypothetical protein JSV42_14720 [Chloroflexota bacterium]